MPAAVGPPTPGRDLPLGQAVGNHFKSDIPCPRHPVILSENDEGVSFITSKTPSI